MVVVNNEYTYPIHIYAAPEFFGKGRYYRTDVGTVVREVYLGLVPGRHVERFPLKWRHETIQIRGRLNSGKRIIWRQKPVIQGEEVTYWLSDKTIHIGDRREE